MSTTADRPSPFVNPRPGVVTTLGLLNITFSIVLFLMHLTYIPLLMAIANNPPMKVEPIVEGSPLKPQPEPKVAQDPMAGMNDPNFTKFAYADLITGLIINGLMFAIGVGLVNLKGWSGRWCYWLAWSKMVRLILLYGVFIVAVAPSLSSSAARAVAPSIPVRPVAGQPPPVVVLTQVYNVMFLIYGFGMIIVGSIYPAATVWLLGKPGVKAVFKAELSSEAIKP